MKTIKEKVKFSLLFISLIFCTFQVNSQISHGGKPLSFSYPALKKASAFELPSFDYQKMLEEDLQKAKAKPYRYGKTHEVDLSPENSGTWHTLEDGRKIWQLRVKSENAYSISIISNLFKFNSGAKLFIFSLDRSQIIGSFTDQNNLGNGYFSTIPVAGSEIIIEIDLEANSSYGVFKISGIVHDYKNILGFGSSGACNVNINCPEGNDWQNEKRAVVKMLFMGTLCTGSLINNTNQDRRPYILTANHCISTQTEASAAVFWFNYESFGCVSSTEPTYQTISSSSLISTGDNLDFSLLELSTEPPANFNVYYAGWNSGTQAAVNTVCIHHPSGDIKKISIDNEPPVVNNYAYLENSHWKIIEWNSGTTEGGSSGSPLFDQNHRIIGDLTGGDASCFYNFNDNFSRFDLAWDNSPEPSNQLKYWLDPLNSGVTYLDGLEPNAQTEGLDATINSILKPNGTLCADGLIAPQVIIYNNGNIELTSLTLNYQIEGNSVVSEQWTGNLLPSQAAIYTFNNTQLPFGQSEFKSYIANPNGGVDLKRSNDTLYVAFKAQDNIETVNIVGDNMVCVESLNSNFSSDLDGTYLWNVVGGEINGSATSKDISVAWQEWGTRKVNLNVTNLCNSADATPLEMTVVEQGVHIEFYTSDNASEISWSVTDCEGNLIYQLNGMPSNSYYSESLNLLPGCYALTINSDFSKIDSFSVSNLCDRVIILSGKDFKGLFNEMFSMDPSNSPFKFNLYPNPTSNELNIEAAFMELYEDATFCISNLSGQIIVPSQIIKERLQLELNRLPDGIYVIKIISPRGHFSGKIVKQ